jgi:hypothetical protein
MGIEILASDPRIVRLVGRVSCKTIYISETQSVFCNSSWEGGSRTHYSFRERVVDDARGGTFWVATHPGEPIEQRTINMFGTVANTYALRPGLACILTGTFQGKTMPPRVELHAQDYAELSKPAPCTAHEECRANAEMAAQCAASNATPYEPRILAILGTFGFKSSYRKSEQDRLKVTPDEIERLVTGGLVSRNRAGAMSLTAQGKIARSRAA